MDPASFFLIIVVTLGVVAAGLALVLSGVIASRDDQDDADRGERPTHTEVTTPYHEHTDMTGAGGEREAASADVEHQAP